MPSARTQNLTPARLVIFSSASYKETSRNERVIRFSQAADAGVAELSEADGGIFNGRKADGTVLMFSSSTSPAFFFRKSKASRNVASRYSKRGMIAHRIALSIFASAA